MSTELPLLSLDMLRLAVEHSSEFVLVVDRGGRILDINQTQPGIRREDVLGSKSTDWMLPDYQQPFTDVLASAFETGEPQQGEFQAAGAHESIAWYSCRFYPVESAGRTELMLIIASDITVYREAMIELEDHRDHLEQLLESRTTEIVRASARLRDAQRLEAVGRLAGGIAHAFNNLLTGILGAAELALDKLPEDTEAHALLRPVPTLSQRGADLVARLLAFSRQAVVRRQSVELAPLVGQAVELLRQTLPETIEIETEIAPTGTTVHADPEQIRQVLVDLATNAADAMPDGGTLWLSVRPVTIDNGTDLPPGNYVQLTVRDTGVGMTEELRQRLFEPFFTTKQLHEGPGLGLSVVHGIIATHQGGIDVTSSPGRGTEIVIHLPALAAQTDAAVPGEAPQPAPAGKRTVLIVEDEESVLDIAVKMLTHLDYDVITATNGEEGLAAFRENKVDMVLTDVIMPRMGGEALYHELVAIAPDLPVVLMSGYTTEPAVDDLVSSGRVQFVQKPFKLTLLEQTLEQALTT